VSETSGTSFSLHPSGERPNLGPPGSRAFFRRRTRTSVPVAPPKTRDFGSLLVRSPDESGQVPPRRSARSPRDLRKAPAGPTVILRAYLSEWQHKDGSRSVGEGGRAVARNLLGTMAPRARNGRRRIMLIACICIRVAGFRPGCAISICLRGRTPPLHGAGVRGGGHGYPGDAGQARSGARTRTTYAGDLPPHASRGEEGPTLSWILNRQARPFHLLRQVSTPASAPPTTRPGHDYLYPHHRDPG